MEREIIVERIREGIKKAFLHGTKSGRPIGRPRRVIPNNFKKYYSQWTDKKITAIEFARLLEMSRSSLYRYIKLYELTVNN